MVIEMGVEIQIYKAPASYFGVPSTTSPIATLSVLDAMDYQEKTIVPLGGRNFVVEKVAPPEGSGIQFTETKVFIELPNYVDDITDFIKGDLYCYPLPLRGQRAAYLEAGRSVQVTASACCNFKIVKAPYAQTAFWVSAVEFYEFSPTTIGAPVAFPSSYVAVTPTKAPAGGDFYDITALLYLVTPDPRSNPILVLRLQQGKEVKQYYFTYYNLPVAPEFNVRLTGRAAFQVFRFLFSQQLNLGFSGYILIDGWQGLKWIEVPPNPTKSNKAPFIFRKALSISQPTFVASGSPTELRGVTQLQWGWKDCSFTSYSPLDLGDIVIVRVVDTNRHEFDWLYKVISVDQRVRGNETVYEVKATHPISMSGSIVRQPFRPHLLTTDLFVKVIKALAHYPKNITLDNIYSEKWIFDNELRSFNTLHEALEYLMMHLSPRPTMLIDADGNISIVPASGLTPSPLPTAIAIQITTSKNESTNTVRVSPTGVFKSGLVSSRGVYVSTTYPIDYRREYQFAGFWFYRVGAPVTNFQNQIEWVEEVSWRADAAGEIFTTLKVIKYA
jgi:hypothetical protein